jgi:hypothetical protein
MNILKKCLLGALTGLGAFWSFVIVQELTLGKPSFDWESFLGEAFSPLALFSLFSRRTWQELPLWINIETIWGVSLILTGAILGIWLEIRKQKRGMPRRSRI